jgi:hypothetical protein
LYSLSSDGLKPIHDWVGQFERFWSQSFDHLADYLDGIRRATRPRLQGLDRPGTPCALVGP